MLVIFSVNIVWLAAGNLFSKVLQNAHTINIVFAVLLVWSVWHAVARQSVG